MPNREAVRRAFRQGRNAGVSEADLLSHARVSVHSGLNIVYSRSLCLYGVGENGEKLYVDGFYDPHTNRIVINPRAKDT